MFRLKFFLVFSLVILIMGCSSSSKYHLRHEGELFPPYSGPKARIAVDDVEIKASKAANETGSGLRELLLVSLQSTNRFIIRSQEPAESPAADVLLKIALVEFEPQASGGRSGVGGGGGANSGAMGGFMGKSLNKANLSLEVAIIDASSAQATVIASSTLSGQASDYTGINAVNPGASPGMGKKLSAYSRTPMEKAMRICIIETTRYIAENVPKEYYKY